MKNIYLLLIVYLITQTAYSQTTEQRYFSKSLSVNVNTPAELTDDNGQSLNINNIYRVHLVTRNTGTDTGAEYLVWYNDNSSIWRYRAVNISGDTSNHPILFIDNNVVKIKTNHPNLYTIKAFVEELNTQEADVWPNIFGSSYQWQREKNSLFYKDGNVGIGNSNPSRALVINGSAADNLVLKRNGGTDANNTIKFENENVNMYVGASTSNDFAIGFHPNLNSNAKFIISSNTGNVGIGTTNPDIWKLAVNGEIRAKEIKVETGWSDFVFENTYQLPSLKEVENHIQQKGHLKDIPSAKEVEENGIFLGEMDAKLLQKIEELTLYTIAQEKKILSLEKQNSTIQNLEKEIEILKEENKEIKQLNKKLIELQNKLDRLIQVK
ncbi:hypothetical protein [Mesonia oceanica]|uniref:Uncharacterized protein n=1 Tax=Mesonia oceanica TaxID=2687242 RepID=A0AC61YAC6_9FLAO|nr:hypothetical protein [Mesonia oceanica]VVV01467.1 hypothetical protein FVB9532_02759 [Mesonia oceanica]